MNKQQVDWSIMQRQGGAALLIIIFKTLMQLFKNLWPLLIGVLFTGKGNKELRLLFFAGIFLTATFLISILEYFFFRFQIINNELIIRKGFLTKKLIALPLEKIIAVHIEQTWLHRIFNSAQVSFDTAGTEKTEVVIKAIQLAKAESLRSYITEQKPDTTIEEATAAKPYVPPIVSLSGSDLLKLCLSANHIEALFILLAFIVSVVDNISEATGNETTGILSWLYSRIDTNTLSGIVFLLVSVLLISIAVSSVRVLLRYSNFRIIRSEKGFSIRNGLLNTKEKLVAFKKIQYLSWKTNWLREKIGIYLLQFHVAGSNEIKERMEVKVPVTQRRFVDEILKDYREQLPISELVPVRTEKEYITRKIVINGVLISIILFGIGWFIIDWYAVLFYLLIPYTAFTSWLFCQKFKLWMMEDALQLRKGVFGKEKAILYWYKIQGVHFRQSIYQQRKNLATLKLFTAGGIIIIPFIKKETAMKIYNYALYKAESEKKNWM
jgi:putative membrane protein